jgi:succinate dehydrogenase / fumarate reductase cytochrome b subunit
VTEEEKTAVQAKRRSSRHSGRWGIMGWLGARGYRIERYLYTLHRITGVGLVVWLFLHVYSMSYLAGGRGPFEYIIELYDQPMAHLGEFLMIGALIFHGLNGLRLGLLEFGFLLGRPKRPVYPFREVVIQQAPRVILITLMVIGGIFLFFAAFEYLFLV